MIDECGELNKNQGIMKIFENYIMAVIYVRLYLTIFIFY